MKPMLILALGLVAPGAVIAAPKGAPPSPKTAPTCFWVRQIDNYTVNDDEDVVYLKVRPRQVWRLELNSRCIGLQDGLALPIRTFAGVGSVCSPQDIDLEDRGRGMSQRCFVRDMAPLTEDEIAALPKRLRP